jgi:DNA invertase Pin-like site-specific DNA recombinase
MKIGYVRVSTVEQNTIRQEVLMQELGVDKVYIDHASGKDTARPALKKLLESVTPGDTVIVESYSRLARSTRDLLDIVETLKDKGVEFISKKEAINTTTPAGRLMLTVFAGLYQFERECMLERQAEGIAEAKKAGKYKGRQPIAVDEDKFKELYTEWKAGKITAVAMQKALNLTAPTFYRRVREFEA